MAKDIKDIKTGNDFFEVPAEAAGMPLNQVNHLISSDDWALVVQSHAVVESAVNSAISRELKPPQAAEWVLDSRTPFVRKLDLIASIVQVESNVLNAIKALSEIRNDIAHTVSGLSFTFDTYLVRGEKEKAKLQRLARATTPPIDLTSAGLRVAVFSAWGQALIQLVLQPKPASQSN